MKNRALRPAALTLAGIISTSALIFAGSASGAGTATLTLSPASGSYANGSSFTVQIYENSGSTTIQSVEADLTYNASQLQYVSLNDTTASAFDLVGSASGGSGAVSISLTKSGTTGLTGSQPVASVTFKALAGSGSTAISFASSSAIDTPPPAGLANIWDGNTSGAAFSLTTPSTPSGGSSGGSSAGGTTTGGTSTGSTGTKSTSTGKTATSTTPSSTGSTPSPASSSTPAPVISNVKVVRNSDGSVTVTWQTNVPTTSILNYGLNSKLGAMVKQSNLVTAHTVTLNPENVNNGQTYYFQVVGADAGGHSATSSQQKFSTPGFTVTVTVVDKAKKPIKDASVTLNSQTHTSDSKGQASFQDVPSGPQKVVIKAGNKTTTSTIQVGVYDAATHSYVPQNFSLTAAKGSANSALAIGGIVVLLAVIAGVYLLVFAPSALRPFGMSRLAHVPVNEQVITAGDPDIKGLQPPVQPSSTVSPQPTTPLPPAETPAAPQSAPSEPSQPPVNHDQDKPGPGATISPSGGA